MKPELQPLVAPDAVSNSSLNDAKTILFPQLFKLALQPTGLFGIATGAGLAKGSGPGGSFTEQEMTDLGLLADDKIFLQYQLGGAGDLNVVAEDIRILAGYRGDTAPTPDPDFWYADRVRKVFTDAGLRSSAADNAMLNIPGVKQALEDALKVAGSPTPVTNFKLMGPVKRIPENNALKGLVSIKGADALPLAVIEGPPISVWNEQPQDVTEQIQRQGVDVGLLLAAMQKAVS
jgi:hypothetical protein